jgi:hypothetical protein
MGYDCSTGKRTKSPRPAQTAKSIMQRTWCIVKQFGSETTNNKHDAETLP